MSKRRKVQDRSQPSFVQIDASLIKALTPFEFIVYAQIKNRAWNKDGKCWESIEHMAEETGMSRGSLQKALKSLFQQKLIGKEKRPGGTDVYTLNPPEEWVLDIHQRPIADFKLEPNRSTTWIPPVEPNFEPNRSTTWIAPIHVVDPEPIHLVDPKNIQFKEYSNKHTQIGPADRGVFLASPTAISETPKQALGFRFPDPEPIKTSEQDGLTVCVGLPPSEQPNSQQPKATIDCAGVKPIKGNQAESTVNSQAEQAYNTTPAKIENGCNSAGSTSEDDLSAGAGGNTTSAAIIKEPQGKLSRADRLARLMGQTVAEPESPAEEPEPLSEDEQRQQIAKLMARQAAKYAPIEANPDSKSPAVNRSLSEGVYDAFIPHLSEELDRGTLEAILGAVQTTDRYCPPPVLCQRLWETYRQFRPMGWAEAAQLNDSVTFKRGFQQLWARAMDPQLSGAENCAAIELLWRAALLRLHVPGFYTGNDFENKHAGFLFSGDRRVEILAEEWASMTEGKKAAAVAAIAKLGGL